MTQYEILLSELTTSPRRWVVTGAAGFIGSHLVETLLRHGQTVTGMDNFATGTRSNLAQVEKSVSPDDWSRFTLAEADVRDLDACRRALEGADHVLHQAGIGSVPLSIEKPREVHDVNVTGFLNMLISAQEHAIGRVVYASSSSVYGDDATMPKVEACLGTPLSPYAASKLMDEVYAATFHECHGLESAGLRYFNVFGPRQDPHGAYAAVIPYWLSLLKKGATVYINGDGETTRDFCYVANVVQANLLAATAPSEKPLCEAFNVGLGECMTLNELYSWLQRALSVLDPRVSDAAAVHRDARPGDVRHSMADISKAKKTLGYSPTHPVAEGLHDAIQWYWDNL
jgi:UDP-N-acetylglucosamine 4-epimerase